MKKALLILAMSVSVMMMSCKTEEEVAERNVGPKGENGHAYVDLGLSVKWAACNIGASVPEENGYYYSWGELNAKSKYTNETCLTNGIELGDISGDAKYDVASSKWGGSWRVPTGAEIAELIEKCEWKMEEREGVKGYKVTGTNGNSIFLPMSGHQRGSSVSEEGQSGCYMSSTAYEGNNNLAYNLDFDSAKQKLDWGPRLRGFSVRPVKA